MISPNTSRSKHIAALTAVEAEARKTRDEQAAEQNSAAGAAIFRAYNRVECALLTALDDGSATSGEEWRIRTDNFLIGRVHGDCTISHDPEISTTHAEVRRERNRGGTCWSLHDLGSTNGTLVRVGRCVLRPGDEVLLGQRRYRFMTSATATADTAGTRRSDAREINYDAGPGLMPIGHRASTLQLSGRPQDIGSSTSADLRVERDPYLCARHATIACRRGRWIIRDRGSVNGIWKRMSATPIDRRCQFLIGGQRFSLRVL